MKSYLAKDWGKVLEHNGLGSFASLWQLELDWFEEPNQRRGGWSGVSRMQLDLPQGGQAYLFIKRQQNHLRKTYAHPVRGIPTFRAEIENILRLRKLGIPTMEPLYYAERRGEEGWQCILITSELTGHQPLDRLIEHWHDKGWSRFQAERRNILLATASVCSQLHRHRLVHRALHAKHLFVNPQSASVCFIDLEKMRSTWSPWRAMLRDLDALNRHAYRLSRSDRLRFLLAYFNERQLTAEIRRAWHELAARQQSKPRKE